MSNKSINKLTRDGWRRVLLHPFLFDQLVYGFLVTISICVIFLLSEEANVFVWVLCVLNLLIASVGLFASFLQRSFPLFLHLGFVLLLVSPCIAILFNEADLRLSIFALPGAYLLQLGLTGHRLKRISYALYNLLLLVGLLVPMISSVIKIEPYSSSVQIVLFVIIFSTIIILFVLYAWHVTKSYLPVNEKKLIDHVGSVIQTFSQIIVEDDEIETVLKKIVHNVIPTLELEDCVIYLLNEEGNILIQKAAYGLKNDGTSTGVANPIELSVGQGIVGSVAEKGVAEIVHDTTKDPRYIQDEAQRYSELAVPIIVNEKVRGVIDSEHSSKNYFNEVHLYLMQIIASLCASKMVEIDHLSIHKQSAKLEIEAKKLQETNEVKSHFISNLSHDLKTPLTLILGPIQELDRLDLAKEEKELIDLISTNGKELRKIIEELLQLNEMAFLAQGEKTEQFDLGLLMHDWANGFNQRCQQKKIDFQLLGERSLLVDVDKKKLTAILFSLFDDLLKTSEAGSEISIKYVAEDGLLKCTLKSSQKQQVPSDLRVKLDLVEELVKKMDASLTTTGVDGIVHELVVANAKQEEKNVTSMVAPKPLMVERKDTKPVVLVIEDHRDLRLFVQQSLEEEYVCVAAENGERGIELAEKFVPDLIVTDLMLGGLSGEEVCRYVRSKIHLNHIPIIVLSAKSMTMDRVDLYELGAENYLVKPFEMAELKAIISGTLDQREKLKESYKSEFLDGESNTAENPFIDKVIALINENLSDGGFNVKQLSTELEIGRNQLQRKVKMVLDMTPVELIRHCRLEAARKLLLETDLSVSEIAYEVGFNNLSYFSRAFKGKYGELPSDLRTSSISAS
ncbi:MAG: helix-turn-helix domain-containing protein [Flavobacteriales bacterium]|nr:helix-turn-helix domain-containing protein [Flavobacteriales bacterium]